MKLQISASAAGALAALAVVARVVSGVLIDMPDLLNAGWLAVLIGALLALPLAFAVSRILAMRKKQMSRVPRPLCAAFFAVAVWDAASVASMIADSAGYMALNSTASIYLMIPQFALCLVCLRLNGDALGASASIWNKFLPALLLIVILLQAENYESQWLTPVLGPGMPAILSGALRTAGWFSLPAALFLIAKPDVEGRPSSLHPVRTLAACAAFSALIAVIFSMTTPAISDQDLYSRTIRFDALLANGRNGLSIQLPMIALWYPGLFYALLFDVFTGAVMLQEMLPQWNHRACIWLSIISSALFAASRLSGRKLALSASGWLFALLGACVALLMLKDLFVKGEKRRA